MYQTARGKVDLPKEHFRALVLRLLGDKDHTKVYEAVAKVEKRWAQEGRGLARLTVGVVVMFRIRGVA